MPSEARRSSFSSHHQPHGHDDYRNLLHPPRRRISYVLPEKQKRKFQDGTPRSEPGKALRGLIKKVQENYFYAPLAPDEDIRVLILEPGRPADPKTGRNADPIRCRLVPSALPSTQGGAHSRQVIPYEALSYYWGLEEPTVPITIVTYNSSAPRMSMANIVQKKFWIRPNLHAALIQLRSSDPANEVALWVDAICINQQDKVEKTAQVSRMHEIYSAASNICIWLGVGEIDPETGTIDPDETEETFDFIRQMLSLRRLDQLVQSEDHTDLWLAFVRLMRNRWFSRRWVVQELALAKEATVHCGEEVIQWRDFADAVALFVTKQNQINSLLKKRFTKDPDPIGDMRALGANTLVEATSNLFRRATDGRILERLLNMETLVSTLLAFEATDPRDIVYAVLSIANDTPYSDSDSAAQMSPSTTELKSFADHRITPNYDKTLVQICTDFIEYCVEKSDSLDILVRHWAPAPKRQFLDPDSSPQIMPTWVSLITGSAFGDPEAALQGRSNGDSLVGISTRQHQKNYNACASLRPWALFDRRNDGDGSDSQSPRLTSNPVLLTPPTTPSSGPCSGVLFVKGICLDVIGQLSPRAAQGMILQECLEMGGWTDEDGLEKVPDSLWRTFVADRGPDGKSAPSWYRRACLECLTHITQNGDLSTGALIENHNTPTTMVTFLKRVQRVVWNRKFFRSRGGEYQDEGDQLFGLAPTKSQVGDLIVILYGCSVPVLLREFKTKRNHYFELVGEAYVHGMMDGEAFSREKPGYPYDDFDATRTFKIC